MSEDITEKAGAVLALIRGRMCAEGGRVEAFHFENEANFDTLQKALERQRRGWDFLNHMERQRAFSEYTFGPGPRVAGILNHIEKEMEEVEANPTDLEEWIDIVMLALDGAWRSGATPQEIAAAIDAKMDKNESRDWPDWREVGQDKAIEHIRKTCRACVHSYMEPDAPTLICGHPDAGSTIFGLHIWKEPLEHCGFRKFKQHPSRNSDGSIADWPESEGIPC